VPHQRRVRTSRSSLAIMSTSSSAMSFVEAKIPFTLSKSSGGGLSHFGETMHEGGVNGHTLAQWIHQRP